MRTMANGIDIHYELSGNPNAPVVVLSHSLAASMVMWEPQMAALQPHFRVLRYDMRGHGESEVVSGEYTFEMLGNDVVGLMDALNIQQAYFVGLSIGGMIGQELMLNHANRLHGAILCSTTARLPLEAKSVFRARMGRVRDHGMAPLADEALARWFTGPFRDKGDRLLNLIQEQIKATAVAGFLGCGHAILGLDYTKRLSAVKLDTLIIVGEDDPGTPVSAAKAIQREIPNSKLVILPSSAHLCNIEQAQRFNTALLDFLGQ